MSARKFSHGTIFVSGGIALGADRLQPLLSNRWTMLKKMLRTTIWWGIKKITRHKGGISRKLRHLAHWYLQFYYDQHTDDFATNGEAYLINSLKSFNINCIFDVGANVGEWSFMAYKEFPNASIHAFELSRSTYEILKNSVPSDRVIINNVALSNYTGVATYKEYTGRSELNTLIGSAELWDSLAAHVIRESKVTTGDSYCKDLNAGSIDILKIDAEGSDYFVLCGFDDMLTNRKIRLVQFEYGYLHADAGVSMKQFFSFFSERGYIIGKLWNDGVEFTDFFYWLNNYDSGPNFVAVRSDDVEIRNALSIRRTPTFSYFQDNPAFLPILTIRDRLSPTRSGR
jgi:FkbM family methyltransferase